MGQWASHHPSTTLRRSDTSLWWWTGEDFVCSHEYPNTSSSYSDNLGSAALATATAAAQSKAKQKHSPPSQSGHEDERCVVSGKAGKGILSLANSTSLCSLGTGTSLSSTSKDTLVEPPSIIKRSEPQNTSGVLPAILCSAETVVPTPSDDKDRRALLSDVSWRGQVDGAGEVSCLRIPIENRRLDGDGTVAATAAVQSQQRERGGADVSGGNAPFVAGRSSGFRCTSDVAVLEPEQTGELCRMHFETVESDNRCLLPCRFCDEQQGPDKGLATATSALAVVDAGHEQVTPRAAGEWNMCKRVITSRRLSDDFELLDELLGWGLSGAVQVARCRVSNRRYAVKRLVTSKGSHTTSFPGSGLTTTVWPGTIHSPTDSSSSSQPMSSRQESFDAGGPGSSSWTEIEMHLRVDHPNVVKLLFVYVDLETTWMVMEYCNGKELYNRLEEKGQFMEAEARAAAIQMFSTVCYLESCNIVHRDLKLENWMYEYSGDRRSQQEQRQQQRRESVHGSADKTTASTGGLLRLNSIVTGSGVWLRKRSGEDRRTAILDTAAAVAVVDANATLRRRTSSDFQPTQPILPSLPTTASSTGSTVELGSERSEGRLKLIDFGFARVWNPHTSRPMRSSCGSLTYISPDALSGSYTRACDLWALGVIVYMLLSGEPPFCGRDDRMVLHRIRRVVFSLQGPKWEKVSHVAKHFITALLTRDYRRRLTAKEALAHPWLAPSLPPENPPWNMFDSKLLKSFRTFHTLSPTLQLLARTVASGLTTLDIEEYLPLFRILDRTLEGSISLENWVLVLQHYLSGPSDDSVPTRHECEVLFYSLKSAREVGSTDMRERADFHNLTYTDVMTGLVPICVTSLPGVVQETTLYAFHHGFRDELALSEALRMKMEA